MHSHIILVYIGLFTSVSHSNIMPLCTHYEWYTNTTMCYVLIFKLVIKLHSELGLPIAWLSDKLNLNNNRASVYLNDLSPQTPLQSANPTVVR